jgi:D-glycero-alpha-D-manno-heptose-7-phosphate kinase
MIIRSKAPLRIGLAGGGTDVSPYSDLYGGAILNATINLFAYCHIEPNNNNEIKLVFIEKQKTEICELNGTLPINENDDFVLIKGVYNYLVKEYNIKPASFTITTFADAPAGSGLGTSSTVVVAILGAFAEWWKLPLGEYDIAHLAYKIEREFLGMAGGKQDQYAAAFGGVNFMEFIDDNQVIVNPLRIKQQTLNELENNLLLYYTETSRMSSKIIEAQKENVNAQKEKSIDAMHALKQQAFKMKEALLKGKIDDIGKILDSSWQQKKLMAAGISNSMIDSVYDTAMQHGATGGKISGAGGGGHMILYCPATMRYSVIDHIISKHGGRFVKFSFTKNGLSTWLAE